MTWNFILLIALAALAAWVLIEALTYIGLSKL